MAEANGLGAAAAGGWQQQSYAALQRQTDRSVLIAEHQRREDGVQTHPELVGQAGAQFSTR